MIHQFYYASLRTLLDAVEATPRDKHGTYQECGSGSATDDNTAQHGRLLDKMVTDCRAMHPFTQDITAVEALANQLTVQLPAPRSVKRRRLRAGEGDSVDVDRILAGDLAHAWTVTRRILHDDPTTHTTMIIPLTYGANMSQSIIWWNMAATLALAWLLEQSGRRTCLVALEYGRLDMRGDPEISITTILKDYDDPWSLQAAITTTDRAFLRRLMFRLEECLPTPPGGLYAFVPGPLQQREHLDACAREYGWRHWLHGAHPNYSHITDEQSALAWLHAQIEQLEGVAL